MKTSQQWWEEVKNDEAKLIEWLKDQYHGEVTAGQRIDEILEKNPNLPEHYKGTLRMIAMQEKTHAKWVGNLLKFRGIEAEVLDKESPYWNETLPKDFITMPIAQLAAIATLAENMRLERIKAIASDEFAPSDIRSVFLNILPQEEFHERAFSDMTSKELIAEALTNHKKGRNALGLVP